MVRRSFGEYHCFATTQKPRGIIGVLRHIAGDHGRRFSYAADIAGTDVGTLSMEGLQRCLLQFYREIGACDNMSISRSQESSPNRSPTQTSAFEKTLGERLTPSRQKPRCSPPRSQPQYSPPKKHSPPKHSLPWQQPRYSPPRLYKTIKKRGAWPGLASGARKQALAE